jgi:glutamyl-tRNA synthetase
VTLLPAAGESAEFGADGAKALLAQACETAGAKKGLLMKSLRAALLGKMQGPDLIDSWLLLNACGEDRLRIERCLS